ncbi:MAG: serine hydrolase domain-containing protein [Pseudohongiellaceae bacterium]
MMHRRSDCAGFSGNAAWAALLWVAISVMPLHVTAQPGGGLPAGDAGEAGLAPARLQLLDAMLDQHVDDGRVPGLVVAVARHGRLVHLKTAGWQTLDDRRPMQADSLFQIRSMSKPITAVAVMQLWEQGRLRLDDPVADYIPAFLNPRVLLTPDDVSSGTRRASRQLTIEDLLLHQGGLSHRFSPLYRDNGVRSRDDTLEELVEKVAAQPLVADPGALWNYSISTTVLGRIVEIISGQRFDAYLDEHVFGPLKMTDTGFHVPSGKVDRLARAYQLAMQPGQEVQELPEMETPITELPALLEGAAGMVSSAPDYLRFLQTMLNGGELDGERILQPDTVRLLTTSQLDEALRPLRLSGRELPGLGWGYGFSVMMEPEQSRYGVNQGEFGWNGSLGTFSWADPQTGTIALLLMQVSPSGAWSLADKFKSLVHVSLVDEPTGVKE